MKLNAFGENFNVSLVIGQYQDNDSLYVGLWDEDVNESFADITVNIPDYVIKGIPYLAKNAAYIDTNNMPEIVDWLIKEGIAVKSPYVKRSFPLVFFSEDVLRSANAEIYGTYCKQYIENEFIK